MPQNLKISLRNLLPNKSSQKKLKNKNSLRMTSLFLSIFIILVGFLFFGTNDAYASGKCKYTDDEGVVNNVVWADEATCTAPPKNGTYTADTPVTGGTCTYTNPDTEMSASVPTVVKTVSNEAECTALPGGIYNAGATYTETKKLAETARQKKAAEENCSIGSIFNGSCALVGILKLNSMLLAASAALFGVVVDTDKIELIVGNDALYTVWMEVRDFLNIAFILFLLYSAFSIIFQIGGKFGEKKIILTIVLMALLVNFSFPIARFIVDISNSLMYTMLNQFFPTSEPTDILTGITAGSAFTKILNTSDGATYSQLFAAIIFTFLLAMTFLALAVMFLIRIIALAILIIFSPIAFVGNIAGKDFGWWDNMIKYAFFGPIMVFVLHIAIFTMSAVGTGLGLTDQDSVITSMANMSIPIVILWMGMGLAQKMGIEGASQVMGAAQKVSKGAAKKFSGFNVVKKNYDDYKKERNARHEEARWKMGKGLGERVNNAQDSIVAGLGSTKAQKRLDKRRTDKNKKDIEDDSKDLVDKGATVDTLARDTNTAFAAGAPRNKKEAIKQAAQGQAYLKQEADDRKTYIMNQLKSATGANAAGTDITHMLNAAYINDPKLDATANAAKQATYERQRNEALAAATTVTGRNGTAGYNSESDMRTVHSFINRQMKSKVEAGANA